MELLKIDHRARKRAAAERRKRQAKLRKKALKWLDKEREDKAQRKKARWIMFMRAGHGTIPEKCALCGIKDKLTVDHIIPISKGGGNGPGNLQFLCRPCHDKKDGVGRGK